MQQRDETGGGGVAWSLSAVGAGCAASEIFLQWTLGLGKRPQVPASPLSGGEVPLIRPVTMLKGRSAVQR